MPRPFLPLAMISVLATGPVWADCELLYAPPQVRARLLAFHHANELRRAHERQSDHGAARATDRPARAGAATPPRERTAPARPPAEPG